MSKNNIDRIFRSITILVLTAIAGWWFHDLTMLLAGTLYAVLMCILFELIDLKHETRKVRAELENLNFEIITEE